MYDRVMSLTLKQLRYFVAAAETGQISLAAIEMNISQSAVTAAVQGLEAQLGVRLLSRGTQGVTLTPEGARFLSRAREILGAVEEAVRSPLGDARRATGTVRLAMSYTVAGYFLSRHLAAFRRSYPGIALELHEMARARCEEALEAGAIDIAVLLTSNIENAAALEFETLFRSRRRLWLPIDHPLLALPAVPLAEVVRQPYIMLTVDEAAHTQARFWRAFGREPQVIFATSSVEAVRSMVAAGMGVTVLSDMVYRPWSLEGQRIEQRPVTEGAPSMDVGLVWARGRPLPPPVEVFRSFLALYPGIAGQGPLTGDG